MSPSSSRPRRSLRRLLVGEFTLGRLLRSLLFIYLALALYAYFWSDRLIFRPQPSSYQDSREIIKLTTTDGIQISALHLPNPQATQTILYSHGNAEDLGDIRPVLEQLRSSGFSLVAYDYRGYGTSQGTPSELGAYRDIDAAYRYVTQTLRVPPAQVIVYGRSVGGGPSVDLAVREPIGGLVLESTFTSAFEVFLPLDLFPFDKFANLSKIKAVRHPVLVIHGVQDGVIPFQHGQRLYDQANPPKYWLPVPAADHNDVMQVAGKQHAEALRSFGRVVAGRGNGKKSSNNSF